MKHAKTAITSADFWLRLLYILLFALAWQITELLLVVVVALQIGSQLLNGAHEPRLTGFGNSLSQYAWQIGRYATGATEQKPWPFMEWPDPQAQWHVTIAEPMSAGNAKVGDAGTGTPGESPSGPVQP
ncbi:DUF4389 domain-containing protein [Pseudomonas sp. OIL-1]|uniref:DUF4389 domain-containing protein n=1 Tax=Pseudomonas sp. OIL-1 TaxID=2706126 RepID=UPI0013A794FF|nr:DUF4389 domain-containing protein [Pseudomonas sp. OIL-1]QIB52014.1 DUF4389 domain-containing protein [Pseudomonas sp. OIL-1]